MKKHSGQMPKQEKQSTKTVRDDGRGAKARERLIVATLKILETKPIDAISTREIAARSKQNISAISYYFGGKDGLYAAAVRHVLDLLGERLNPLLREVESHLDQRHRTPEDATADLKKLIFAITDISRDMVTFHGMIIAREQMRGSKGFSTLYDGMLDEVNYYGARLLARAIGGDETDKVFRLRFCTLAGTAGAFLFARQAIIRAMGWRDIGDREQSIIAHVVEEHIDMLLAGFQQLRQSGEDSAPQSCEAPVRLGTRRTAMSSRRLDAHS